MQTGQNNQNNSFTVSGRQFNTQFNLGDLVRDTISQFQGVCTGILLKADGTCRYIVESNQIKEKGQIGDSMSIESYRLELEKANFWTLPANQETVQQTDQTNQQQAGRTEHAGSQETKERSHAL